MSNLDYGTIYVTIADGRGSAHTANFAIYRHDGCVVIGRSHYSVKHFAGLAKAMFGEQHREPVLGLVAAMARFEEPPAEDPRARRGGQRRAVCAAMAFARLLGYKAR
jgi:hypothetical protein